MLLLAAARNGLAIGVRDTAAGTTTGILIARRARAATTTCVCSPTGGTAAASSLPAQCLREDSREREGEKPHAQSRNQTLHECVSLAQEKIRHLT